MSCFTCATPRRKQPNTRIERNRSLSEVVDTLESFLRGGSGSTHSFSYRDLSIATQNFHASNLVGEGGFGRVYKGRLDSGQVVAVKKLDREGMQGSSEFLVEAQMLIVLRHANLVSLIGYCAEKNNRLLVYEFMSRGSLDYHLFDLPPDQEPLDWNTRIKVAVGASRGLTYLHDEAKPAVIYRDLKSANILLDDEFNPKLSDFGLAKLGPVGGKTHVSTRVMGTYGYCAPDYAMSGKLTAKSDVYSFGVVLLELITGRMAYDSAKKPGEQNLIPWSRQFLNNRRMCCKLADPLLKGCFPILGLYRVAMIISTCLQEQPHLRPTMHDVTAALDFVASQPYVSQADSISCKSPSPSSTRDASADTTDDHQGDTS